MVVLSSLSKETSSIDPVRKNDQQIFAYIKNKNIFTYTN